MKTWLVPYRETYCGTTAVEAETAEDAVALVEAGYYDVDPGAERVDWGKEPGRVEEVK